MKGKFILTTAILFSMISVYLFQSERVFSQSDFIMLEDFQKYNGNPFSDWSFQKEYEKAASIYSIVEENGNKYLRASTLKTNSMVQLGKEINKNKLVGKNKVNWNIYSYPFISWDWRVHIIPAGANENDNDLNDSAASIYVVFQKSRVPFTNWQKQPANWIKYVWSSTLPVGTVVSKKVTKMGVFLYEGKTIVVATGKKDLGKWITFKRNVLADYQTHFGGNPSFNPSVIGILTDSNSTGSKAEADYDNIKASGN